MNITEIRKKYPQYQDMSDSDLAQGLHKKYYSDMPFEEFTGRIGLQTEMAAPEQSIDPVQTKPSMLERVQSKIGDLSRDAFNNLLSAVPGDREPQHGEADLMDVVAHPFKTTDERWGGAVAGNVLQTKVDEYKKLRQSLGLKEAEEAGTIPAGRYPLQPFANQGMQELAGLSKDELQQRMATAEQDIELNLDAWLSMQEEIQNTKPATNPESVKDYLGQSITAMIDMTPTLATAYTTRGRVSGQGLGLSIMGTNVFGNKYAEIFARTGDGDKAFASAFTTTLSETGTELIPLSVILRPGKKLLGRIMKSAGAEGATEALNHTIQAGMDKSIIEGDMTFGEALSAIWSNPELRKEFLAGLRQSFIVGATLGGGAALAVSGADKIGDEVALHKLTKSAQLPDAEQQARDSFTPKQPDQQAVGEATFAADSIPQPTTVDYTGGNAQPEDDATETQVIEQQKQAQPWQMTKQDWEKARNASKPEVRQSKLTKASASEAATSLDQTISLTYGVRDEASQTMAAAINGDIALTPEQFEDLQFELDRPVTHKEVVQKALAEGKPIPSAVLAEYPDLQQSDGRTESGPASSIKPSITEIKQETSYEDAEGRTVTPAAQAKGQVDMMMPGDAYVGDLVDSELEAQLQTRPRRGKKKALRREDVLKPFLKSLNVPLYQGRVKRKGVLGFYMPGWEAVRIKKMGDLETAAHEMAHLIDDLAFAGFRHGFNTGSGRPNTRPWYRGPKHEIYAKELASVSYDKKKVYEGFSEFVRLWMTQPDKAKERAPQFHEWWEDFVSNNQRFGPPLRAAKAKMVEWFTQDPLDRAASKIGGDVIDINDALIPLSDRFRQATVDDMQGILRLETSLTGERAAVKDGIYENARLMKAANSIVDGALRYGPPKMLKSGRWDYIDRHGNPSVLYVKDKQGRYQIKNNPDYEPWGMQDILKPVAKQLDDWVLYAVGRSAAELKAQGRENLFTKEEIKSMLALENDTFKKVFDDYQVWNSQIVDFAVEMGLINAKDREMWRREQYIPFHRIGQSGLAKKLKGVEGNVSAIHMLTGGTGNLNNILDNMVQNASRLIVESIKNHARARVVQFAKTHRGGGRFLVPINKDSKAVGIATKDVVREMLKSIGVTPAQYELLQMAGKSVPVLDAIITRMQARGDYTNFFMHGQAPKGDNVIAVMVKGKPEYFEVIDDLLYQSMVAFNPKIRTGAMGAMYRALSVPRRFGQATVTLTPDFMAANIVRDTLHGWAISKHGFKPVLDSIAGLKSRVASDAAYRAFIANGGGMASYLVDPKALEKNLRKFYSSKGIDYNSVINTPGRLLYLMETLADSFEVATRIGEFKKSVAAGETPRHSAYSARELTDYAMRGDSEVVGFFYDTVMFLKAGVNGMDRFYRGVTKDTNRALIWYKTGVLASISVALYLLNRDNPCYKHLEDWDKDTHWHIFLSDGGGDCKKAQHYRIPKIWEIGAIATTAERAMGAFLDGIKTKHPGKASLEFMVDFKRVLFDLFKMDYVPFAVEPLYETYVLNENRFTGRQIETPYDQSRLPFARYSPYTNDTLVALAEQTRHLPPDMQLSPKRMEALIRGYFNTYGLYGLMLFDGAEREGEQPTRKLDQYPVLRRFTRTHPLRRTQAESDFWKLYDEVQQTHNTLNFMVGNYRPELAEEQAELPQNQLVKLVNDVKNASKKANDQILVIVKDPDMPGDEKRKQIDTIQEEKNQLFIDVMNEVDALRQ